MKWKTKDGRELDISEMETDHIENCIKIMKRNGYISFDELSFLFNCIDTCGGEMARFSLEQETLIKKPSLILDELETELMRRKLVITS